MEKKQGRGGKRNGAGRPKGDSKLFALRLPGNIARKVEEQENKTEFIKNCIIMALEDSKTALSQFGTVVSAEEAKPLHLPYFNQRIVAGFPIPLDNDERSQDIDMLKMLCPHPEASYLIRVQGDSMIDADIHSGDIVIVDKSNRNPSDQDICVCQFNGEYTLKYFEREGDHGWLVPANKNYPRIKITSDDDFNVWGVVTYIIHRAKKQ